MLVVLVESKNDWISDLASKMLRAAGTVLGRHGGYLKPVFIVMGRSSHKNGVFVKNPYDGGPSDFSMKMHIINMRNYPDPDCNSPMYIYSDFMNAVRSRMQTPHFMKAEPAIQETLKNDSMDWFFNQNPERITQLAEELDGPNDGGAAT